MTDDPLAFETREWPEQTVIWGGFCISSGTRLVGVLIDGELAQRICALLNEHGGLDLGALATLAEGEP